MSQQINQDNTYTEQRLSEIMLLSLFGGQQLLHRLEATSPPTYHQNLYSAKIPAVADWDFREFTWMSLQKFSYQKSVTE